MNSAPHKLTSLAIVTVVSGTMACVAMAGTAAAQTQTAAGGAGARSGLAAQSSSAALAREPGTALKGAAANPDLMPAISSRADAAARAAAAPLGAATPSTQGLVPEPSRIHIAAVSPTTAGADAKAALAALDGGISSRAGTASALRALPRATMAVEDKGLERPRTLSGVTIKPKGKK
jgi:hypothetical protein